MAEGRFWCKQRTKMHQKQDEWGAVAVVVGAGRWNAAASAIATVPLRIHDSNVLAQACNLSSLIRKPRAYKTEFRQ